MPIYEYECRACGDVLEVMQKINDRPLRKCRKCSGRLQKLISRTSFHLKGGGWFSSGYAKGEGKAPKTSSGNSAKSEKKAGKESKSDSKSDSKKEGGQVASAV